MSRRDRLTLAPFLALALAGCGSTPAQVRPGPLYAAEPVPSGHGLVYVYWPREQQAPWKSATVRGCEEPGLQVLPGGYATLAVEPGPSCLLAEVILDFGRATVGYSNQGQVEVDAKAGQAVFYRLEWERPLLFWAPRPVLRPVPPPAAEAEIRRCRRMEPFFPEIEEEIRRAERERGDRPGP